jgi:hypothetical protein
MNKFANEIKSHFYPYDRSFSAQSLDGIAWHWEKVMCIEASDFHPVTNAFYCYVHQSTEVYNKSVNNRHLKGIFDYNNLDSLLSYLRNAH